MARTTSKPKLTYAISFGLAGGPAHARRFNHYLQRVGFRKTPIDKADIIIAHSGGTWLIPLTAKPRLVIYIGMPLAQTNPRQTWRAARMAMRQHGQLIHSRKTLIKNSYYLLLQPHRNFHMVRIAKTAQPITFPDAKTIFISNHHDPWTRDENLQDFVKNSSWAFISMSGSHDDIWEHSEHYVDIINHYAGLLG